MKRRLLLILGWLAATTVLYIAMVALELYWNLFAWQPHADGWTAGLLLGIAGVLAAMRLLARAGCDPLIRVVSLVACLALLAIGAYVLLPEPITQGLFARTEPSPLWYRGGRFALMLLPTVFWCLAFWRRTRKVNA